MTLRTRLALVAAVVVAVVLAAASVTTYFVMRHELYGQVDAALSSHLAEQLDHPHPESPQFGPYANDYVALFTPAGQEIFGPTMSRHAVREIVGGPRDRVVYRNAMVQGHHVRLAYATLSGGGAVAVLRLTDDIAHELKRLRVILLLVSLGGVAVAAIAGALVSRATLAPVRRLTGAAERIARTQDPSERVPETGRGELARLAGSFNTMLAALDDALETQRRFVADASHELRTPLTSLQTNIDVLRQQDRLDPEARARLLADLERESHEMRDLIAALLELARGEASQERRDVQLDELVSGSVERARSRFPEVTFDSSLEPTVVQGVPERLERAVWNLLENAGKWSPPGGAVEVTLVDGELRVRDHGPGIAPEDRERIFDRFYRAAAARSLPGSGLGLAIVRDVAESHGGSVSVEDAPGGGALLRLRFAS